MLDPRTIVDRATGKTAERPTRCSTTTISTGCSDHYVAAARLAYRAGYQFVDVKQCHRYLLNELLGARSRPGQVRRQLTRTARG